MTFFFNVEFLLSRFLFFVALNPAKLYVRLGTLPTFGARVLSRMICRSTISWAFSSCLTRFDTSASFCSSSMSCLLRARSAFILASVSSTCCLKSIRFVAIVRRLLVGTSKRGGKKDSVVADRLNVSKDLNQQIELSELRRVYI
jgi:hypothetical protein